VRAVPDDIDGEDAFSALPDHSPSGPAPALPDLDDSLGLGRVHPEYGKQSTGSRQAERFIASGNVPDRRQRPSQPVEPLVADQIRADPLHGARPGLSEPPPRTVRDHHSVGLVGQLPFVLVEADEPNTDRRSVAEQSHHARDEPQPTRTIHDHHDLVGERARP
jgi:hypothetical protein